MSSIGTRLKESREKKGLLQSELAKLIGVKSAGVISNWEQDVCKPDANKMVKICQVLGISLSYLLNYYGTEKAPSLSDEAMKLATDYDDLDRHGKRMVRLVTDEEMARRDEEDRQKQAAILREQRERLEAAEEIAPDASEMLVYINPAAAGTPLYAESDFERMTFPSNKVPRGTDFGIRISGRSMEPTVMDGSIAWVRKRLDMPNGTVGIFMLNDSAVCKRFFKEPDGSVRLESDNPAFPDVTVAEFDALVTVGEVVGMV